jgi:hypothetical protein
MNDHKFLQFIFFLSTYKTTQTAGIPNAMTNNYSETNSQSGHTPLEISNVSISTFTCFVVPSFWIFNLIYNIRCVFLHWIMNWSGRCLVGFGWEVNVKSCISFAGDSLNLMTLYSPFIIWISLHDWVFSSLHNPIFIS